MKRRKFVQIGAMGLGSLSHAHWAYSAKAKEEKPAWLIQIIRQNDQDFPRFEALRISDPKQVYYGGFRDGDDIPNPQTTGYYVLKVACAVISPESSFYQSQILLDKAIQATQCLLKMQHPDGTIDLLSTNFHSPPDTAFSVEKLCVAYALLQKNNADNRYTNLMKPLETFLKRCGESLVVGGIHTPNHRWVVSGALAKLYQIWPDPRYKARAEEWLQEHIDLDPDGQYTEKSAGIYSAIINKALIAIHHGFKKPALLEVVRKNLEMTLYYVHPNMEVVTDASNRQDKGGINMFENYYYAYRYLAILDKNPRFAAMCRLIEKAYFPRIGTHIENFLDEPFLWQELPAGESIPTQYVKSFPYSGLVRIRRDKWDSTILVNNPNFLTFHHGNAILQGLRLAASFFGKGQFQSPEIKQVGNTWLLQQSLDGPYFQPHAKEQIDPSGDWEKMPRSNRKQSEIQYLETKIQVKEIEGGLNIDIDMKGTDGVPVSLELIFRGDGQFEGVIPSGKESNAYLLKEAEGKYTLAEDSIRFGPGRAEHKAIHLRGGLPFAQAPSVYITGFTPFSHQLYLRKN
ncbi:prenyltransferase/squalene oxidase repeat-containing protein [Aquirufa sp. OSTEICH-129A]